MTHASTRPARNPPRPAAGRTVEPSPSKWSLVSPRIKASTDNLVRTFGLEPVDYDGIRDVTQEHITRAAQAFGTALNEKALQIHLQRITGFNRPAPPSGRAILRHQEVGCDGADQQAAQRRPRRGP